MIQSEFKILGLMIKLQEIYFPNDCKVIKHIFHSYDPLNSFNEEDSFDYLSEDLLQCVFPSEGITIDLGWYGDLITGVGEFKIEIIRNENWEVPENEIFSKSMEEITLLLNKILDYYTTINKQSLKEN